VHQGSDQEKAFLATAQTIAEEFASKLGVRRPQVTFANVKGRCKIWGRRGAHIHTQSGRRKRGTICINHRYLERLAKENLELRRLMAHEVTHLRFRRDGHGKKRFVEIVNSLLSPHSLFS